MQHDGGLVDIILCLLAVEVTTTLWVMLTYLIKNNCLIQLQRNQNVGSHMLSIVNAHHIFGAVFMEPCQRSSDLNYG